MSRIRPKREDAEIDSVKTTTHLTGDRRAFDALMEAQYYWNQMDEFRRDRERNKRYTYGYQWDDIICVDGKAMTEEEYILSQGNVPLKNNLIRRLVKSVLGVYRSQMKEPTCTARDRDEQKPRYRCHDYQNGDIFKIDTEDYYKSVVAVNEERMQMAKAVCPRKKCR